MPLALLLFMKQKPACKNILIAEDNMDIREALQEALNCLKTLASPTLVLLDLMMPVMSGWEFLDTIRQFCGLPVSA
jgi:CheY-like chemotaxis protein